MVNARKVHSHTHMTFESTMTDTKWIFFSLYFFRLFVVFHANTYSTQVNGDWHTTMWMILFSLMLEGTKFKMWHLLWFIYMFFLIRFGIRKKIYVFIFVFVFVLDFALNQMMMHLDLFSAIPVVSVYFLKHSLQILWCVVWFGFF